MDYRHVVQREDDVSDAVEVLAALLFRVLLPELDPEHAAELQLALKDLETLLHDPQRLFELLILQKEYPEYAHMSPANMREGRICQRDLIRQLVYDIVSEEEEGKTVLHLLRLLVEQAEIRDVVDEAVPELIKLELNYGA